MFFFTGVGFACIPEAQGTSRWDVLFLWASFILSPVLLSDYEVVREPELLEDPPS